MSVCPGGNQRFWPPACCGASSCLSKAALPFLKHLGQHHGKALCESEASAQRSSPRHAAVLWKMPLLQNEHARSSPSADLHVAHLATAGRARAVSDAGSTSLKCHGRKQCAQPKWGRLERCSAAKLPVVRLEHELCAGRAKRRQLLHLSDKQSTIEANVALQR